jgi:hypothetical protein
MPSLLLTEHHVIVGQTGVDSVARAWFLGERMSDIFQFDLIEDDTLDGYRVISSDLRGKFIGYTMPLV